MTLYNIGDIFVDIISRDAGDDEIYCMIVKIEQGYYTIQYFKPVEEEETIFSFTYASFDRYFRKVSP
jgi:hypothetical protein